MCSDTFVECLDVQRVSIKTNRPFDLQTFRQIDVFCDVSSLGRTGVFHLGEAYLRSKPPKHTPQANIPARRRQNNTNHLTAKSISPSPSPVRSQGRPLVGAIVVDSIAFSFRHDRRVVEDGRHVGSQLNHSDSLSLV